MADIFQIVSLGVVAALACCVIREYAGGLSAVLSVAACTAILLLAMRFLRPVLDVIERLQSLTGLSGAAVAPMLKVTGIGILTQICGAVCEDAGEKTLNNAVQIGGTFLSVYAAVPLISAVIDLLEEMLG